MAGEVRYMADNSFPIMPLSAWMSLAAIVAIAVLAGVAVREWGGAEQGPQAEGGGLATSMSPSSAGESEPTNDAPTLDDLLARLASSQPEDARIEALRALAAWPDLGERREAVIQAVTEAADRRAPVRVRKAALACLGELGADTPSAIGELRSALEDTNAELRIAALQAVEKIGPGAAELLPSVLQSLAEADPEEIGAAALALSALGRSARQHTDALVPLLAHEAREAVGARAAEALIRIGGPGEEALRAALQDPSPWVRYHAAMALLGEKPASGQPPVTDENVAEVADRLVQRLSRSGS